MLEIRIMRKYFIYLFIFFANSEKESVLMSSPDLTDDKISDIMRNTIEVSALNQKTTLYDKEKEHNKEVAKVIDSQKDDQSDVEPLTDEDIERIEDDDYKSMENYINNKLQAGHWPSINSKDFFERFHDWLILHLEDFVLNGRLGISLEIRYFLCTFIIIHLPSQYGFFFPKFLVGFIDENSIKNDQIREMVTSAKRFLRYVEEGKSDYLMITFTIYRTFEIGANEKSLEWIKKIPKGMKSNPADFLLSFILDWKFKADGYDEWKEKNKV